MIPPVILSLVAAGWAYAVGVTRLRARGNAWSGRRTAALTGGLLAVAVALLSPLAAHDDEFPVHAAQHLLLGMLAPLLLALSAPVTLALRTLPARPRRWLLALLHRQPVRLLAAPEAGALLAVGGLYALYLTPLYAATLTSPALHALTHAHFLAAGCLLAWALVGVDPVAGRASFPRRAAVLLAALVGHAVLAKLLVVTGLPGAGVPAAARELAARVLWYGGDAADALLLVAFFARWYAAAGRRLDRDRRREAQAPPVAAEPVVAP